MQQVQDARKKADQQMGDLQLCLDVALQKQQAAEMKVSDIELQRRQIEDEIHAAINDNRQ